MNKWVKNSIGLAVALTAMGAAAHSPLCSCYDSGGKIQCEGGFSDGSSASGVKMRVVDAKGAAVVNGAMDKNGNFEFKKPQGAYKVIFDGGPGHSITIDSKNIVQ